MCRGRGICRFMETRPYNCMETRLNLLCLCKLVSLKEDQNQRRAIRTYNFLSTPNRFKLREFKQFSVGGGGGGSDNDV